MNKSSQCIRKVTKKVLYTIKAKRRKMLNPLGILKLTYVENLLLATVKTGRGQKWNGESSYEVNALIHESK